jgi:hypothetical protein
MPQFLADGKQRQTLPGPPRFHRFTTKGMSTIVHPNQGEVAPKKQKQQHSHHVL